jgi:NADH-quinone oxidoreductase subunit J
MTVVFYLFAVVAIMASVCVITLRNPVHCALALVAALFSTAGIYILLNAEFLAAMEVIIYAGAIMVLFLFVLMCLNIRELRAMPQFNILRPVAVVLGVFLLVDIIIIIVQGYAQGGFGQFVGKYSEAQILELGGNTKALGQVLYSRFLLPFEVISVVLLVAMIGAIVLMKEGARKK